MPVRYMGTKRHLAHRVRAVIDDLEPHGPVVDLFSGMGSVAEALAPMWPVITNDFLAFTSVFGRSRFLDGERRDHDAVLDLLRESYRKQEETLRFAYRVQLAAEERALQGKRKDMADYMASSRHVGDSRNRARAAKEADFSDSPKRKYRLLTLYFSAGYFSLRQALQLDALRLAIDQQLTGPEWDWAIASWLSSASSIINSPGHTAQFLKPTSKAVCLRIQRSWSQNVWKTFEGRLEKLIPVGTKVWRGRNGVSNQEALSFLGSPTASSVGAVYADPPYTHDHYSRYYHVFETMYRYDFPVSTGSGRYRGNRLVTDFSVKTRVKDVFESMSKTVAGLGVPLILSYPDNGLLADAGGDLPSILKRSFRKVSVCSIPIKHSTMGASSGSSTKLATENIYVCKK